MPLRKFFPAPRAYLLTVCFFHGSEIAGTAAILFLIRAQRLPAAFAPQGLFLQGWICFPVICPPLDTASVATEAALCAGTPFRLKVFSAIRADLNGRLIIRLLLFLPFLIMVQLPATLSAKPPPAPGLAALLDWCSAFRTFVDRRVRKVQDYLTLTCIFLSRLKKWAQKSPEVVETSELFASASILVPLDV